MTEAQQAEPTLADVVAAAGTDTQQPPAATEEKSTGATEDFSYEYQVPEGLAVQEGDETIAAVLAMFKEDNIPKAVGEKFLNKLLPLYAQGISGAVEKAKGVLAEVMPSYREATEQLLEAYGSSDEMNKAFVNANRAFQVAARSAGFSPEEQQKISGLWGNSPAMVRLFAAIGSQFAPGKMPGEIAPISRADFATRTNEIYSQLSNVKLDPAQRAALHEELLDLSERSLSSR